MVVVTLPRHQQRSRQRSRSTYFLRSTIETGGLPGYKFFPHVGKIRIDGPNNPKGASDSPSRRKIYVCHPSGAASEATCAKQIVSTLARHAFRRPVTDQDTEMLMGFYQIGRNSGGDFDHGIEMAVRRVLVDPRILFPPARNPFNRPLRSTGQELPHRATWHLASRLFASSCGAASRTTNWPSLWLHRTNSP